MRKRTFLFFLLIVGLFISFFISLTFGGGKVSLDLKPEIIHTILWQIRFPRIILSILVGAGLATSGCIFQAILRNPLAEPYTLGISGGAAFGASLGIILKIGTFGLPVCAFLGALLSVFLIYLVASRKFFSIPSLILGGVILSFVFSSLVLLIFALSQTQEIHSTLLWLMGDLSGADFSLIKPAAILILGGILFSLVFNREIDILTLGEEKATHLGVDAQKTLKLLFLISSLITGSCVAVSGIIGFVGLIIPHFIRHFTGPTHRILIPASCFGGAIFLCLADTLARSVIYPIELPVGVITGILGGAVFLFFLLRSKEWKIF